MSDKEVAIWNRFLSLHGHEQQSGDCRGGGGGSGGQGGDKRRCKKFNLI